MRWPVTCEMPSTMTVSTEWERLLRSFILVSATARLRAPISITCSTSSLLPTSTCRRMPTCFHCLPCQRPAPMLATYTLPPCYT